jgi:hypothetical protein
MIVSRGLVGPKMYLNRSTSNGKQVNIPVLLCDETNVSGQHGQSCLVVQALIALWRTVMVRRSVTCDGVSRAMPGTREKGTRDPYQDPTQVPLVKKT